MSGAALSFGRRVEGAGGATKSQGTDGGYSSMGDIVYGGYRDAYGVGGGVFVYYTTHNAGFEKTGGTIYGSEENPDIKNTYTHVGGCGHAVYFDISSGNSPLIRKRDSTVAASENLNGESDTGWVIVDPAP